MIQEKNDLVFQIICSLLIRKLYLNSRNVLLRFTVINKIVLINLLTQNSLLKIQHHNLIGESIICEGLIER